MNLTGWLFKDVYAYFLDVHPEFNGRVNDWRPYGHYTLIIWLNDGEIGNRTELVATVNEDGIWNVEKQ